MTNRFSFTFGITIVATALTAGPSLAAQRELAGDAQQRFEQSVRDYMTVRHAVDRSLPALDVSGDTRAIEQAVEMRAAAIRRARAGARAGDVFTADVGELFRTRIRQALEGHGHLAADLLRQTFEESEGWEPPPVVNGRFSWKSASATPGCVLAVLPALPEELQFRFVGSDLGLVDIGANLIIDVLPDALEEDLPAPSSNLPTACQLGSGSWKWGVPH
jgi:hypothetical protein